MTRIKTIREPEEGAIAATPRACIKPGDLLQLLDIIGGDFRLEIPDFVERAFGKHGKVPGILGRRSER